jgi:hypothetical protein
MPYDKQTQSWYFQTQWHGAIERQECTKHSYRWSGKMPCTGVQYCVFCGKYKEDDLAQKQMNDSCVNG